MYLIDEKVKGWQFGIKKLESKKKGFNHCH